MRSSLAVIALVAMTTACTNSEKATTGGTVKEGAEAVERVADRVAGAGNEAAREVKEAASGAAAAVRRASLDSVDRAEKAIADLDREVEALQTQLTRAGEATQKEWQELKRDVDAKRMHAKARLAELRAGAADAASDLSAGLEKAVNASRQALRAAKDRLGL